MLIRTRPKPRARVVHLGLGAFFRAHGALYFDQSSEGTWGVTGVSLRSPKIRDTLAQQDWLYTVAELSAQGMSTQTVDILTHVLVAPQDPNAVLQALAAPQTAIVSLSVTEKGYCRGPDGVDFDHPEIAHDLHAELPRSAPGFLVRGLQRRRAAGLKPFTVLSFDNLPSNGKTTCDVVLSLAHRIDPTLAEWIAAHGAFPNSMVDRIVPATTPAVIDRVAAQTGVSDPACVSCEPFCQWVVEDRFVDGVRPDFAKAGARVVADVAPFEHMKLRLLNGAHTALAYQGLLQGHKTVAQAMQDPVLSAQIDRLWHVEIIPSLVSPDGVDLNDYTKALRQRFENPQMQHRLDQIAMDGSQKMPQRILDTVFENRRAGRPYVGLLGVVAAWVVYLAQRSADQIADPIAPRLVQALASTDTDQQVRNFLQIRAVFGGYPVAEIEDQLVAKVTDLRERGQR